MEKPILSGRMGESAIDPGKENTAADSKATSQPFQESPSNIPSIEGLKSADERWRNLTEASETSALARSTVARLHAEFEAPESHADFFAKEALALLSPLVETVLHDANGQLDLAKVPAHNFAEFKQFLLDQVTVDGMAFNGWASESIHWKGVWDSYRRVLNSPELEPVLERMYASAHPEAGIVPKIGDAELKRRLRSFTHQILSVSTDRFAGAHLDSKEGRERLREILQDGGLELQLKADLIRSIGRAKVEEGDYKLNVHKIRDLTSSFDAILFSVNIHNLGVKEEDVEAAGRHALSILDTADYSDKSREKQRDKYQNTPEKVSLLCGVGVEDLKKYAALSEVHEDQLKAKSRKQDARAQLRSKLAGLWLLAADDGNWRYDEAHASADLSHLPAIRKGVLDKASGFIDRLDAIRDPEAFQALNEEIRTFLKSPQNPEANSVLKRVDDLLQEHLDLQTGISDTLEDFVKGMDSSQREPFDALLKFSGEIWAAKEMGEALRLEIPIQAEDPHLKEAADQFAQGLEEAKRKLWSSYKQLGAVSRGLSQSAEAFGTEGAIAKIRAGNAAIDAVIEEVQKARSPEALKVAYGKLYEQMRDGGKLHQAFLAAEMDGTEQLIALGQSMVEMLAISAATEGAGGVNVALKALQSATKVSKAAKGLSAAAKLAKGVEQFRSAQKTLSLARTAQKTADAARVLSAGEKALKGFKLGAQLSTAENLTAKLSDQMAESDTLLSWAKDALATGASMALTAPFGEAAEAVHAKKPILKKLWLRYTQDAAKGLKHFAKDSLFEGMEEVLDAFVRQNLDGKRDSLSWDQFRDIVNIALAGGGAEKGLSNTLIGGSQVAKKTATKLGSLRLGGPDLVANPLFYPMWAALGAGGIGSGSRRKYPIDAIKLKAYETALARVEAQGRVVPAATVANTAYKIYRDSTAVEDQVTEHVFKKLASANPEVKELFLRSPAVQKRIPLSEEKLLKAFRDALGQLKESEISTPQKIAELAHRFYCEGLPETERPSDSTFQALAHKNDNPKVIELLRESGVVKKYGRIEASEPQKIQAFREALVRARASGVIMSRPAVSKLAYQIYCQNISKAETPASLENFLRLTKAEGDLEISSLLQASPFVAPGIFRIGKSAAIGVVAPSPNPTHAVLSVTKDSEGYRTELKDLRDSGPETLLAYSVGKPSFKVGDKVGIAGGGGGSLKGQLDYAVVSFRHYEVNYRLQFPSAFTSPLQERWKESFLDLLHTGQEEDSVLSGNLTAKLSADANLRNRILTQGNEISVWFGEGGEIQDILWRQGEKSYHLEQDGGVSEGHGPQPEAEVKLPEALISPPEPRAQSDLIILDSDFKGPPLPLAEEGNYWRNAPLQSDEQDEQEEDQTALRVLDRGKRTPWRFYGQLIQGWGTLPLHLVKAKARANFGMKEFFSSPGPLEPPPQVPSHAGQKPVSKARGVNPKIEQAILDTLREAQGKVLKRDLPIAQSRSHGEISAALQSLVDKGLISLELNGRLKAYELTPSGRGLQKVESPSAKIESAEASPEPASEADDAQEQKVQTPLGAEGHGGDRFSDPEWETAKSWMERVRGLITKENMKYHGLSEAEAQGFLQALANTPVGKIASADMVVVLKRLHALFSGPWEEGGLSRISEHFQRLLDAPAQDSEPPPSSVSRLERWVRATLEEAGNGTVVLNRSPEREARLCDRLGLAPGERVLVAELTPLAQLGLNNLTRNPAILPQLRGFLENRQIEKQGLRHSDILELIATLDSYKVENLEAAFLPRGVDGKLMSGEEDPKRLFSIIAELAAALEYASKHPTAKVKLAASLEVDWSLLSDAELEHFEKHLRPHLPEDIILPRDVRNARRILEADALVTYSDGSVRIVEVKASRDHYMNRRPAMNYFQALQLSLAARKFKDSGIDYIVLAESIDEGLLNQLQNILEAVPFRIDIRSSSQPRLLAGVGKRGEPPETLRSWKGPVAEPAEAPAETAAEDSEPPSEKTGREGSLERHWSPRVREILDPHFKKHGVKAKTAMSGAEFQRMAFKTIDRKTAEGVWESFREFVAAEVRDPQVLAEVRKRLDPIDPRKERFNVPRTAALIELAALIAGEFVPAEEGPPPSVPAEPVSYEFHPRLTKEAEDGLLQKKVKDLSTEVLNGDVGQIEAIAEIGSRQDEVGESALWELIGLYDLAKEGSPEFFSDQDPVSIRKRIAASLATLALENPQAREFQAVLLEEDRSAPNPQLRAEESTPEESPQPVEATSEAAVPETFSRVEALAKATAEPAEKRVMPVPAAKSKAAAQKMPPTPFQKAQAVIVANQSNLRRLSNGQFYKHIKQATRGLSDAELEAIVAQYLPIFVAEVRNANRRKVLWTMHVLHAVAHRLQPAAHWALRSTVMDLLPRVPHEFHHDLNCLMAGGPHGDEVDGAPVFQRINLEEWQSFSTGRSGEAPAISKVKSAMERQFENQRKATQDAQALRLATDRLVSQLSWAQLQPLIHQLEADLVAFYPAAFRSASVEERGYVEAFAIVLDTLVTACHCMPASRFAEFLNRQHLTNAQYGNLMGYYYRPGPQAEAFFLPERPRSNLIRLADTQEPTSGGLSVVGRMIEKLLK